MAFATSPSLEPSPSLELVRSVGVPVDGLPENLPVREGFTLAAIVTNPNKMQFVVVMSDELIYRSYCNMTRRKGDRGSWFFEKMELFFVPDVQSQEQLDK